MLDTLQFRFKLWQLQRRLSRTRKFFKNEISEARKVKKDRDEIERLMFEDQFESQLIQDEIAQLATQHLYRTAYKYLVPQPRRDDERMWEESTVTGRRHLTDKGIAKLRSAIRKERRERYEHIRMWLVGLTGLVGATAGLVALLEKIMDK